MRKIYRILWSLAILLIILIIFLEVDPLHAWLNTQFPSIYKLLRKK